jgi:hypothetical protein
VSAVSSVETRIVIPAAVEPPGMTHTVGAVERFLRKADAAYEEYEQGYADADATLRRLERHLEDLREAAGE